MCESAGLVEVGLSSLLQMCESAGLNVISEIESSGLAHSSDHLFANWNYLPFKLVK